MSKVFFAIYKELLYLLISGWIIMFTLSDSYGQSDGINFKSIDEQTYSFYLTGSWDSLICLGNYALENDIDYFYLRVRMGTAYYNIANYTKAIKHFQQALSFNSTDSYSIEYLYYSYIYLNRNLEARSLASKFPEQLKKKIDPALGSKLEYIYAEGGMAISNNFERNSINNSHQPNDTIPHEQDLNGNKTYLHGGFGGFIENNIAFYVGYSHLKTSKFKQIITPELYKSGYDTILSNGWYYVDTLYDYKSVLTEDNYNLLQNAFYANMSIALNNGLILTPAIHYLNIKSYSIYAVSSPAFYFAQSYDSIQSVYDSLAIVKESTTLNNYVAALSANYNKGLFNIGVNTSHSNFNYKNQFQLGASVTILPFGNLDLYTSSYITTAWNGEINRFIFRQIIGTKITRSVWVEGFFTLGEMINYNESNAFIVYNSGDKIKFRAGTNIMLSLSKHIELNLIYHYLDNNGSVIHLTPEGPKVGKNTSYQNHTIIGGLKWKL